jgi:prephenate dehydratase
MSSDPETAGAGVASVTGRPRVGYLGPAGTFSEEALLTSAAADAVEPVALASIYDTFMALRRGDVSFSIVPIENSLEGSINVTLDLLTDDDSDVRIVGEALLRVRHSLIAGATMALESIDTVLTHPQVPGQCSVFLRGELAHARVVPASSTAEAVRTVVTDAQPGRAAIGTELAASIYGATVIRERIEDREDNETRFVWLARPASTGALARPPLRAHAGGEWKTSLVFWGAGAERSGWLVRCLEELSKREINLTKIESRPRRRGLGSYMFLADVTAHADDPALAEALLELAAICEEVRVLGSYASAANPSALADTGGPPRLGGA